jgi:hypothetical protein
MFLASIGIWWAFFPSGRQAAKSAPCRNRRLQRFADRTIDDTRLASPLFRQIAVDRTPNKDCPTREQIAGQSLFSGQAGIQTPTSKSLLNTVRAA